MNSLFVMFQCVKLFKPLRAIGGELFDYLTQMVKLSEKKTRSVGSFVAFSEVSLVTFRYH